MQLVTFSFLGKPMLWPRHSEITILTNVLCAPDLDLQLTPSGEVTKQIGEALPVSCTISSSRNATVFWIKVSDSSTSHFICVFITSYYCWYFSVLGGRELCWFGFWRPIVKMNLMCNAKIRDTTLNWWLKISYCNYWLNSQRTTEQYNTNAILLKWSVWGTFRIRSC